MKPAHVDLRGARSVATFAQRVLQTRMGEVCGLALNLERREAQGLHHFRIACKRLRYALERFGACQPALHDAAEQLSRLQDALGEVHDRDVLLSILPPTMPLTERRLRRGRELHVDRANRLWPGVRELAHACALMRFE